MKPTVLGIVIVLALLGAGAIFFASDAFAPIETVAEQTYANDRLGISFSYPPGYVLSEADASEGSNERYTITIIREEDTVPRVNAEGPTAITIDAYQYVELVTLDGWLAKSESNFQLSDTPLASTTIDGEEAIRYRWSGLYEGETTVFRSGERIVAVSVMYMSTADQIYIAYQALLASFRVR